MLFLFMIIQSQFIFPLAGSFLVFSACTWAVFAPSPVSRVGHLSLSKTSYTGVCVWVCVCVRERERIFTCSKSFFLPEWLSAVVTQLRPKTQLPTMLVLAALMNMIQSYWQSNVRHETKSHLILSCSSSPRCWAFPTC